MKERFLLDWIELKRAHVSVRHKQLAASIESHAADAVQAVEDHTPMATCQTTDSPVIEWLVKFSLGG